MILKRETIDLISHDDIVKARQKARALAVETGFGLVDQTKIVTAVSELARNALIYGGGGDVQYALVAEEKRQGLRVVVKDRGPGIADTDLALTDGYTTGGGLGLGLGGARRLMNDFEIDSRPGEGTVVTVTRWKP